MYKYIITTLILLGMVLLGSLLIESVAPAATTTPVTFVNENPGVTQLGVVKFVLNEKGEKVDYIMMNLQWDYHLYVVDLEPGVYGVTQYVPQYDKIVAFQTVTVGDEPMIVKFGRL